MTGDGMGTNEEFVRQQTPETEHNGDIKPRGRGFSKGTPRPPRKSERWQGNTEECFYNWIEDIRPCILTRSGKWEVFEPTPQQR